MRRVRPALAILLAFVATPPACDTDGDERVTHSVWRDATPWDARADVNAAEDVAATVAPPTETAGRRDVIDARDTAQADSGPTGPSDLNAGFIGGACQGDGACAVEGGRCATEAEGLPGGLCTTACDRFCPDQAGATTTFCVDAASIGVGGGGACVMRCDFGLSPTGCRDGYHCKAMARHNEPQTVQHVCVPGDDPPPLTTCNRALIERGIGFEIASNPQDVVEGTDLVCDIVDPVWVDGRIAGVDFRYASPTGNVGRLFASCPLALALDDMARIARDRGVTDIVHLGIYNCRRIGGSQNLSQHALANAVDVAGLKLDDGSYYTLIDDWEVGVSPPSTPGHVLLAWLSDTLYAQGVFNILLTPEYNSAHHNHFHLDLTPGADFYR